jgi:hypothetical protein
MPSMPDLPLLLLPAAAGVVCAALALTAARRRPGAAPKPLLTLRATPAPRGRQSGASDRTVSDAARAVIATWADPNPRTTRAATRAALKTCEVTDHRHPDAAHAEQTALTRYLTYALASALARTQAALLPPDVTVRNVQVDPDAPDATLAELAGARMLVAAIAGDTTAVMDVITRHADTPPDGGPLAVAVAQARVGAIVVDFAARAGVWLRAIPGVVDAHRAGHDTATWHRLSGGDHKGAP